MLDIRVVRERLMETPSKAKAKFLHAQPVRCSPDEFLSERWLASGGGEVDFDNTGLEPFGYQEHGEEVWALEHIHASGARYVYLVADDVRDVERAMREEVESDDAQARNERLRVIRIRVIQYGLKAEYEEIEGE